MNSKKTTLTLVEANEMDLVDMDQLVFRTMVSVENETISFKKAKLISDLADKAIRSKLLQLMGKYKKDIQEPEKLRNAM